MRRWSRKERKDTSSVEHSEEVLPSGWVLIKAAIFNSKDSWQLTVRAGKLYWCASRARRLEKHIGNGREQGT